MLIGFTRVEISALVRKKYENSRFTMRLIVLLGICVLVCLLVAFIYLASLDNQLSRTNTDTGVEKEEVVASSPSDSLEGGATLDEIEKIARDHEGLLPHLFSTHRRGSEYCALHDNMHGDELEMSQKSNRSKHDDLLHNKYAHHDHTLIHITEGRILRVQAQYKGQTINTDNKGRGGDSKGFFHKGMMDSGQSVFQMCIPKHPTHFHSIVFELNNTIGDCDLFVSVGPKNTDPGPEDWDWKSSDIGHDRLSLRTYTSEFLKLDRKNSIEGTVTPFPLDKPGNGLPRGPKHPSLPPKPIDLNALKGMPRDMSSYPLFISVYAKDPLLDCSCHLSVTILPIDFKDAAHSVGSLRGGQVLLPRDFSLGKITRSSAPRPGSKVNI